MNSRWFLAGAVIGFLILLFKMRSSANLAELTAACNNGDQNACNALSNLLAQGGPGGSGAGYGGSGGSGAGCGSGCGCSPSPRAQLNTSPFQAFSGGVSSPRQYATQTGSPPNAPIVRVGVTGNMFTYTYVPTKQVN